MNDYFISVVVPCYNVEKYIMRCVASLISQTIGFENMQVIFVNDASTDNTLSILRKIESAYPENVVLITYDKNLRQGGARNIGLSYATAKYVGFVDADDWIEPEMYEEMYNKMKCGNYDIVRCKSGADRSQEMFRFTPSIERFDQDLSFEKKGLYYWAHQDDKKTGVNGHLGGIWTGLYKKNLIFENEIFFPEGLTYEDNYWGALLRLYTHKIYIIDVPYYHYYENFSSTTHCRNSSHHFDRIEIEERLLNAYLERGVFEYYYNEILNETIERYYINSMHLFFARFDNELDVEVYNRISANIYKFFPNWRKDIDVKTTEHGRLLLWWLEKYPKCTQEMINLLKLEYCRLLRQDNIY